MRNATTFTHTPYPSGYNNQDLHTPTIDALARNGSVLDGFYTYKVCAPARGSLLSGRFPYKLAATRTNFAYFQTLEGLHTNPNR